MPKAHRPVFAKAFARAKSNGLAHRQGRSFESEALRQDGTEIPVEISLAEWSLSGKIFITGIIRDITERKKAEAMPLASRQELAHKSALLQTTLDSVDQGFVVWDTDYRIIAWNEECRALWYHPKDIRIGMPMMELLRHIAEKGAFGPGDADRLAKAEFERVIAEGADSEDEFETLDGRQIWVRRFPVPMGGHASIYTDISEIRRTENQLRGAKDEAEVANRAKSEFLSNMSHELRTPLNAILGFAQLLLSSRQTSLTDRQAEQIGHILQGGEHLLDLINEVLDLSQIEAGKLSLSIEAFDPRHLLDESLSYAGALAAKRNVTIEDRTGADIPTARADPFRTKQVLLNLLSNAVKYNRSGGRIWIEREQTEDLFLRISVTDTGIGIPEAKQGDLFKPFSRLGIEAEKVEGTGIGLALAKQLVEEMGGAIGFRSNHGEGSTFWIDIPLADRSVVQ